MNFKTPYVPHIFGEEVKRRLSYKNGWLTAGVAASITWPSFDVSITYAGDEFFLRGKDQNGKQSPPCITVALSKGNEDEALKKIYQFTSVLSWFMGGYVDVSGYVQSSRPMLYTSRNVYSTLGIMGSKSFNCNYMPIIETENVRRALAFWREGMRLDEVHDGYSFLSFYKVIESQFSNGKKRGQWITDNIEKLTDRAATRVAELRQRGIDVSDHIFDSGRCAVAHASLNGAIVDPDIPEDRRRLSADLVIIQELARNYIRDVLEVPDSSSTYATRNRLEPWSALLSNETLDILRNGGITEDEVGLSGQKVTIGLWPDGPISGFERMEMQVGTVQKGLAKLLVMNDRETILLSFYLDYQNGHAHIDLENSGFIKDDLELNEDDIRAFYTLFYNVVSNVPAQLIIDGLEPIECDVVIPRNMFMTSSAQDAIEGEVKRFKEECCPKDSNG